MLNQLNYSLIPNKCGDQQVQFTPGDKLSIRLVPPLKMGQISNL